MSDDEPTIEEQISGLPPEEHVLDVLEGLAEGYRLRAIEAERAVGAVQSQLVAQVDELAVDRRERNAEIERLWAVLDGLARFLEIEPGDLTRLTLRISTLKADRDYLDRQSVELVAESDRLREALEAIASVPPSGTTLISPPTIAELQTVARNALDQLGGGRGRDVGDDDPTDGRTEDGPDYLLAQALSVARQCRAERDEARVERDRLVAVLAVADDFWPLVEDICDQARRTWEHEDARMKYVTVQIAKADLPTLNAAYRPGPAEGAT